VISDWDVLDHGPGALGKLLPRYEVGVVLHRRDEDFVASFHIGIAPAAGDEINSRRRAGSEDKFQCLFGPDEGPDFFAGIFVLFGTAFAERMNPTVNVCIIAFVDAAEHVDNLPRALGARGVIEEHERMTVVNGLLQNREVIAQRRGQQLGTVDHW
jgi:hypothetical protein